MGMYDSLYVDCPKCKNELEFQSKSGQCFLQSCKKNSLTPEIAVGMNGDIVRCEFCNKRIRLVCKIPRIVKIKLVVTKGMKFDYEGNYNEKHPMRVKTQKELSKIFNKKRRNLKAKRGEE